MLNPTLVQYKANERVKKLQEESKLLRELQLNRLSIVQRLFKVFTIKEVYLTTSDRKLYS